MDYAEFCAHYDDAMLRAIQTNGLSDEPETVDLGADPDVLDLILSDDYLTSI